jgi:hypothetical protein
MGGSIICIPVTSTINLAFFILRLNNGSIHPSYAEIRCIGLNLLSNKASFIKKSKKKIQRTAQSPRRTTTCSASALVFLATSAANFINFLVPSVSRSTDPLSPHLEALTST